MPESVTFDLDTLTLGELAAAEDASGQDASVLLSRSAHRRILALFVLGLRSSGQPPSWKLLESRRVLDGLSSPSASPVDSPSEKSPDSD